MTIATRLPRTQQLRPQLEAPPRRELIEAAPPPLAISAPVQDRNDGDFPPHMLRWSLIGVVVYLLAIAGGMIYGALLTAAAR